MTRPSLAPASAPPRTTILLALLLLALAGLGAGCSGGEDSGRDGAPGSTPGAPPLILISVDTLRWDHVPAYGYSGVVTPNFDALRRDGVLFEQAWTHAPMTLPAHTSMLTGLLPPEHGVRANMGYPLNTGTVPYLPRLLREGGCATGAAVSSFVLRGGTGLAADFDFYEDKIDYRPAPGFAGYQRPGEETLAVTLPWLRSVAHRPFFLFFHIYEPHAPYDPPEPYASLYPLAYDGEIALADRIVGELLDALRELGLYDRALIVLTSDHGDALGDHGEQGHGILVYRSTMQIPLIVKLPGGERAGTTVATPAQLIDLAPTFLEAAGLPVPAAMGGTSLTRLPASEEVPRNLYGETWYTRLYFGWSELRTLVEGRYQYIESSRPELYDLETDPRETTNILLGQERRRAASMRDALAAIPPRFEGPTEFDPETRKRLESLGYLGGARSAYQGELPPPQTQMHLIAALQQGAAHFGAGRYLQAAQVYRKILDENPHMIVAWERLALCMERSGRYSAALDAYQEALSRSGDEPQLALATAEVLLSLGRFDEAVEHGELARSWNPPAVHDLLARVALARGDLARAEQEAQAGLALRPDPGLFLALARVARQRGELSQALDHARQAEARLGGERLRGLYLLLGDLLARSGQIREAEEAMKKEIALFPGDPLAPANLAQLYVETGRPDQALAALRGLVERNPTPPAYAVAIRTLRALGHPAAEDLAREAREKFPNYDAG